MIPPLRIAGQAAIFISRLNFLHNAIAKPPG